jgi:hypothetical protein
MLHRSRAVLFAPPFMLRLQMFASTLEDVVKKKNTSGPSSSMFLAPRRPVFVPNATTMDVSTGLQLYRSVLSLVCFQEGRFSEYDDIYGLLPLISDPDIRFNRVPEVLIFNSTTKEYLPMSFHLLHRLGTGVVLNATIAPMVSIAHIASICRSPCLQRVTGVRAR